MNMKRLLISTGMLAAVAFGIDLFAAVQRKFNRTSDKLGFQTKL